MNLKLNLKQISKFFLVGALATIVDWSAYAALVLIDINYLIALTIAFLFGAIVNFILNRKYTFKVMDGPHKRLIIFISIAIMAYGISMFMLRWLVEDLLIDKIPARIIVTIVIFFFNFVLHKKITFS